MSLLLKNCDWVVTQNRNREVLRNASVLVEDGRIAAISSTGRLEADTIIDCAGKILLPGLVNTHTHLSMSLLRGYADDMHLQEWLSEKIWPLEARLDGEICYAGALLGCMEMIRTGTTSFVDMYFFMEDVARAVDEAGLRGILSFGAIDLFDAERATEAKKKTESFISHIKSLRNPRIRFSLGPHSPYSCSQETLLDLKRVADRENAIIQIHLAETRKEQAGFQRTQGCREVEYLQKIGFLSPNVLAAHCVWLTRSEIDILGEMGVKVAHCPVSNMKLASGGAAPLPEMLASNVTVSLGTDGAASNNTLDMFDTMKVCALLQKSQRWDATVLPAQKILDLATIEGARAISMDSEIGSVEAKKRADLILVNAKSPNLNPIHGERTVISNLVYSAKGENVDTTIVDGKILMHNAQFETLNPEEVYRRADRAMRRLIA